MVYCSSYFRPVKHENRDVVILSKIKPGGESRTSWMKNSPLSEQGIVKR